MILFVTGLKLASVQWGSGGLVFSKSGNYTTAFFEVFDKSDVCTGFVRGEGKSIADAERQCFEKFNKYRACDHGPFSRRGYRNGGGYLSKMRRLCF